MELPEFLKRENKKTLDVEMKEFSDLCDEYERVVGNDLMTEPFSRSIKEWIELLKICIKEKKSYLEITQEIIEIDNEDVYY